MLMARGIGHAFGGRVVLSAVDLAVAPGAVLGLSGPSGAGKSTLARILAGRIVPQKGQVTWNGAPLPGAPGPVQHVPQSPELAVDPRWTVGRILANAASPDRAVLAALGIGADWAERLPHTLSGGELARVSLARFILPGTRVLICDELTAQLDALAARALWAALVPLARARAMGLIIISHDPHLRDALCTQQMTLPQTMDQPRR